MDVVVINTITSMGGTMFLSNKYTTLYHNIIEKSTARAEATYTETHHIIPKSMGGSNDDDNLVVLTPREHYICHALLPKMVEGKAKYKMYAAFNMMHVGQDGRRYTSSLYEYYKIKFYKLHSKNQKGKKRSIESRNKQSEATKGIPWSKKARNTVRKKPTAKAVLVYMKEDNSFVGEWESIALCAKELGCDTTTVWKVCEGKPCSRASNGKLYPLKSHKGYTFKYK
jgi:hypothetical protein